MGYKEGGFRWGDAEEEDEGGLDAVLPPPQVIGPDEKGIKIVIEWRVNEEGQRVKVTKKIRVKKQLKKLKPEVIRRKSLKKFGDAVGQVGERASPMTGGLNKVGSAMRSKKRREESSEAAQLPVLLGPGLLHVQICCCTCTQFRRLRVIHPYFSSPFVSPPSLYSR